MTSLFPLQRYGLTAVLILTFIFVTADVYKDWSDGTSASHIVIEVIIALLSLAGMLIIWWRQGFLRGNIARLQQELKINEAEAKRWKTEHAELLEGLASAIDRQFETWNFTESEKEISLLLLKGLSLKEIAELRQTSERTVRQQTLKIYSKSGVSGRAELSAFFLEDLLTSSEVKEHSE
jgi:DNA-binding CsgD family transcriptional regulator